MGDCFVVVILTVAWELSCFSMWKKYHTYVQCYNSNSLTSLKYIQDTLWIYLNIGITARPRSWFSKSKSWITKFQCFPFLPMPIHVPSIQNIVHCHKHLLKCSDKSLLGNIVWKVKSKRVFPLCITHCCRTNIMWTVIASIKLMEINKQLKYLTCQTHHASFSFLINLIKTYSMLFISPMEMA